MALNENQQAGIKVKRPKIRIGVPAVENVPRAFMDWVIHTMETYSKDYEISFRYCKGAEPTDWKRCKIVRDALEEGYDYICMCDTDTVPCNDALPIFMKYISDETPILGGIYFGKGGPHLIMSRNQWIDGTWREVVGLTPFKDKDGNYKDAGLMETHLMGTGLIFCKREVFEKIEYPWFLWRLDFSEFESTNNCTEDFDFSFKARRAGYKLYLIKELRCGHVGGKGIDEANYWFHLFFDDIPKEIFDLLLEQRKGTNAELFESDPSKHWAINETNRRDRIINADGRIIHPITKKEIEL